MRSAHLAPAARSLALLRIVLGVILLVAGWHKMAVTWVAGFLPIPLVSSDWQRDLPARLGAWSASHTTGATAAIVRDLLLPNGELVAGAVAWVQMVAGVLLLLGLLTRAASAVALLLAGALLLTAQASLLGGSRSYALWLVIALALFLGDAGQTFGLDGWRRERRRGREF